MYKTILVPIDIAEEELTEMVIPHVKGLANNEDCKIHFLAVLPGMPGFFYYASLGITLAPQLPSVEEMTQFTNLQLKEIIDKFGLPEANVTQHVVVGSAKDEILRFSDEIKADLIVMSAHKPDASTYLLGSTTATVVRHATTSVMVVR